MGIKNTPHTAYVAALATCKTLMSAKQPTPEQTVITVKNHTLKQLKIQKKINSKALLLMQSNIRNKNI